MGSAVAGLRQMMRDVKAAAPAAAVPITVTATIASVAPTKVLIDGDTTATPHPADDTWTTITVGQKVRCELRPGSGLVIVGVDTTGHDTGWVPLTLETEFAVANIAPAIRRIGDQVFLRGDLSRGAGGINDSTWHLVATIPAGYRPATFHRFPVGGWPTTGTTGIPGINLSTTGALEVGRIGGPPNPTLATFYLAHTWPVG